MTITHARVLAIAVPIVVSNVTVPLLGAVDTGVIGQLGDPAAIGAVGIGAIIISAIYWVFGFLRMGTTGLAAQALGANDRPEFVALLLRSLMIAGAGGIALILFKNIIFAGAFRISPASVAVENAARDYLNIRIYSAPAAIAIYGITGWLIAQEKTRSVFAIQFMMNAVNVVLDLWFVLSLKWGIAGVAYASLIAEWLGAIWALYLCRAAIMDPVARQIAVLLNPARWQQMLVVNGDILLRSLMLQAIFVSFLLIGAQFDDVQLAANQVLLQFLNITAYGMDGFAFAAEALVGQAIGRKSRDDLRHSIKLASLWAWALGVGMAIAFWIYGPMIIDLMAKSAAVQTAGRDYLIYMVLSPLIGVAPWMLDGVFIGATRGRDMRNMMALSLSIYAMSAYLLVPPLGNHGLWISMLISFAARGVTLALRYPALERSLQD